MTRLITYLVVLILTCIGFICWSQYSTFYAVVYSAVVLVSYLVVDVFILVFKLCDKVEDEDYVSLDEMLG